MEIERRSRISVSTYALENAVAEIRAYQELADIKKLPRLKSCLLLTDGGEIKAVAVE